MSKWGDEFYKFRPRRLSPSRESRGLRLGQWKELDFFVRYVRWERKKEKGFPLNAVIGGVGFTCEKLYIGRCRLRESEFSYVSGYIDSITEILSVPYAGKEVKKENNYEVLVSDKQENLIWKRYVTNESYRPVFSANNLLIGRTCTKMTKGKHYNNGCETILAYWPGS